MTTVTLQWPEEVLATVAETTEAFARELRIAAAVERYREGRVSRGRGSEIAGLDRWGFMLALSRAKVDVIQVEPGELGGGRL